MNENGETEPLRFGTDHLHFRAIEEDDIDFLMELYSDAKLFHNAVPFPWHPRSRRGCLQYIKYVENCLMGVVICIPATEEGSKPNPIGVMHLNKIPANNEHHRRSEFGIKIKETHQKQGLGTEAIKWALKWGFHHRGLHKIELTVFGYNEHAIKVYQKVGFVTEGVRRDHICANGQHCPRLDLRAGYPTWQELAKEERLSTSILCTEPLASRQNELFGRLGYHYRLITELEN